jgi:hypothetical protein
MKWFQCGLQAPISRHPAHCTALPIGKKPWQQEFLTVPGAKSASSYAKVF